MTGRAGVARVIPLVTTRALRGPLDYSSSTTLTRGAIVRVPLAGRSVRAVVVDPAPADPHSAELAAIEGVETVGVPEPLLDLALWIGAYYGSTAARGLALVLPPRTPAARTTVVSATGSDLETTPRRRAILAILGERAVSLAELVSEASTTRPTIRALADAGLVTLSERLDVPRIAVPLSVTRPTPTDEQRQAVERIADALDGARADLLLHGVTGSGKTEVYLLACEHALGRGKSVVVLVPEIALSYQTARRFAERFGDAVCVLHSGLSEGERAAVYAAARSGEVRVIVGARSALFSPLPDLGLVIIDEEHDAAYKQGEDPRYDARRVAAKRTRLEGATLVLGSATPRPESWRALERLTLSERVGGPLPKVEIVDLRADGLYPLSRRLRERLAEIADQGGRGILLLNRRGQAPALHCRGCGHTFRCPNCDISLPLHRGGGLRCHHCGHREPEPRRCPECGSVELARLGAGTERVVQELAELFPTIDLFRLDTDAAARRGAIEEVLGRFAASPRAVLVGTQMVAKGHDFRDLRLACAIDADQGLAWPDFRSEERTFALLCQLAGRSGRAGDAGTVIFQAWDPDQRVVRLAAAHAVEPFLRGELERRELLGYPPFVHLVRVEVSAGDPRAASGLLAALRDAARPLLEGDTLLGPVPLGRVRNRDRAQLLLKTQRPARAASVLGDLAARQGQALRKASATIVVDVDPN